HGVYPAWPAEVLDLVTALEPHRPDLARKTRERLLSLWRRYDERPGHAEPPAAALDRLSLADLEKQAKRDGNLRGEAMARWARLEPARAGPWLTRQLDDKGDDVSHRCDAARALAVAGDRRGLDWLKEACLANIGLGGRPGAALLEAGDAGAA